MENDFFFFVSLLVCGCNGYVFMDAKSKEQWAPIFSTHMYSQILIIFSHNFCHKSVIVLCLTKMCFVRTFHANGFVPRVTFFQHWLLTILKNNSNWLQTSDHQSLFSLFTAVAPHEICSHEENITQPWTGKKIYTCDEKREACRGRGTTQLPAIF